MTGTQNGNPFEQLGHLVDEGNRRTLVIRGKNRVITTLPLGWAVVVGIILLITAWPVLLVGLVILQYTGGSFAIEDAAPAAPPEPPAPYTQPENMTR